MIDQQIRSVSRRLRTWDLTATGEATKLRLRGLLDDEDWAWCEAMRLDDETQAALGAVNGRMKARALKAKRLATLVHETLTLPFWRNFPSRKIQCEAPKPGELGDQVGLVIVRPHGYLYGDKPIMPGSVRVYLYKDNVFRLAGYEIRLDALTERMVTVEVEASESAWIVWARRRSTIERG